MCRFHCYQGAVLHLNSRLVGRIYSKWDLAVSTAYIHDCHDRPLYQLSFGSPFDNPRFLLGFKTAMTAETASGQPVAYIRNEGFWLPSYQIFSAKSHKAVVRLESELLSYSVRVLDNGDPASDPRLVALFLALIRFHASDGDWCNAYVWGGLKLLVLALVLLGCLVVRLLIIRRQRITLMDGECHSQ
jgi:hypothetical protein